jgi:tetratricopeptide (TPR) repeat protein
MLESWRLAEGNQEYSDGVREFRLNSCPSAMSHIHAAIEVATTANLPNAGYYAAQGTMYFLCGIGNRHDSTTHRPDDRSPADYASYSTAVESYRRAIDLVSGDALLYFNLGSIYASNGDPKAGLLFRKAVGLDPGNPLYHVSLGRWEDVKGDTASAMEEYSSTLALSPRTAYSRFFKDLRNRRPAMAMAVVARAASLLAKGDQLDADPIVSARLGAIYLLEGRDRDARGKLEHALDQLPNLSYAWANLGVILEKQGNYEAAKTDYKRAVYLDGANAMSWFRLATLERAEGDAPQAVIGFEAVLNQPQYSGRLFRWYRLYRLNTYVNDDVLPPGLVEYIEPEIDRDAACQALIETLRGAKEPVPASVSKECETARD